MTTENDVRTVLFVCQHGALRSRLAAAWFAATAPLGWRATSAGLQPDETVSPEVARLLSGTPAEAFLDPSPPRPVPAAPIPALVIAIDCALPDAERWDLPVATANEAIRGAIATRVHSLTTELATKANPG